MPARGLQFRWCLKLREIQDRRAWFVTCSFIGFARHFRGYLFELITYWSGLALRLLAIMILVTRGILLLTTIDFRKAVRKLLA